MYALLDNITTELPAKEDMANRYIQSLGSPRAIKDRESVTKAHSDGTFSDRPYSGELVGMQIFDVVDTTISMLVLLFTGTTMVSIVSQWPDWITFANLFALAGLAFFVVYRRMVYRPDHLRARQSDRMLSIANQGVLLLRKGLNPQAARDLCRIIASELPSVAAVAVTDTNKVLGYFGVGEDHHTAGREIATEGTHVALFNNQPQILANKEQIGCPNKSCPLAAAIVVPLQVREHAAGTLKFYYSNEMDLTENELATAEGIADLLSTQLELNELEVQASLTRDMELKALQAQINPHFLFNMLNTITSFIRTDPDMARKLIRRFAQFYRHTLDASTASSTLNDEVEFMEQYVELEQARFGERLLLKVNIDDSLTELPMPSFMLQPLVENCIGHGMRDDGTPLNITVNARWTDEESSEIGVFVTDDGQGVSKERLFHIFDGHSKVGLGIALGNVRERLNGFYGSGSQFVFDSEEDVGTTVTLLFSAPEEFLSTMWEDS